MNTVMIAAGTRIIMRAAGRSGSMRLWCVRQFINSNIIIDGYMVVYLPMRWYVYMAEQYVNGRSRSLFQYHSVKAEDGKQSVGKYVQEVAKANNANITIKGFVRFETGEGLEKKEENFAEEVAKQMK